MELFITQFSSVSYYFLSLWSKYFPQHTVLKYHYKSIQQHIFTELIYKIQMKILREFSSFVSFERFVLTSEGAKYSWPFVV
jgi:hypothetical protein